MNGKERILRHIDAFDRAWEQARDAQWAEAEARERRRAQDRGPARPRRRTATALALFAAVAVGGTVTTAVKPKPAATSPDRLVWRHTGSTIYPVSEVIVHSDGVLGACAPGILVESTPSLDEWRRVPVVTEITPDPRATIELGPAYRPVGEGRVGDILSGIDVAEGGRLVAVGGFLGENGCRDSTTLYRDPRQRLWRRPLTLEADFLHDVDCDGRRGLAVGAFGAVVRTESAGEDWAFAPLATNADLFDVHLGADGGATAVGGVPEEVEGGFGLIIASEYWGAPFRGVYRARAILRAAAVAGDGTGWAVGDRGTIAATLDGGRTWSDQSETVAWPEAAPDLTAVLVDDRSAVVRCAAGARDGTVITRDGRGRWSTSRLPAEAGAVRCMALFGDALFVFTANAQVYEAAWPSDD